MTACFQILSHSLLICRDNTVRYNVIWYSYWQRHKAARKRKRRTDSWTSCEGTVCQQNLRNETQLLLIDFTKIKFYILLLPLPFWFTLLRRIQVGADTAMLSEGNYHVHSKVSSSEDTEPMIWSCSITLYEFIFKTHLHTLLTLFALK
jgi:hypothetical protein